MRYIAHRGYGEPENSLLAIAAARRLFDAIEVDIQVTADGVPVVFHDRTLERLCAHSGCLEKMTFAELKHYPFHGFALGEASVQCIPSMEEAAPLLETFDVVNLEIKSRAPEAAAIIFDAAQPLARETNVIFSSFDAPLVLAAKRAGFRAALLYYGEPILHALASMRSGYDQLHLCAESLSRAKVEFLRMRLGCPIWLYTARNSSDLAALAQLQPEGVFTDVLP